MHRLTVPTSTVVAVLVLSSCGGNNVPSAANEAIAATTQPPTTTSSTTDPPATSVPPTTSAAPTTPAPAPSVAPTTSAATTTPAPAPEPGALPFVDEFDDNRYGWAGPFQSFEDGQYVWKLPAGQADTRAADTLIAVESELAAVAIATEFTAEGVDSVGFECAYEAISGSSQWYNLELGTTGVAIRKRPLGDSPPQTLALDDAVVLGTQPVTLGATCALIDGVYRLELFVDGDLVLEATDTEPFGPSAPGLVVRAAPDRPDSPTHVVRFERFEVTPVSN